MERSRKRKTGLELEKKRVGERLTISNPILRYSSKASGVIYSETGMWRLVGRMYWPNVITSTPASLTFLIVSTTYIHPLSHCHKDFHLQTANGYRERHITIPQLSNSFWALIHELQDKNATYGRLLLYTNKLFQGDDVLTC
jgi:hypothetical protein